MPQESRRLTGYTPFITCDDPRGVIECGKIRSPKKIPTQKKIESQRRKQKNLKIEGGEEEEEQIHSKFIATGTVEEAQTAISFQLMDVVSSWSTSNDHDNICTSDIAMDELRSKKPYWRRRRTLIQRIKAVNLRGLFKNSDDRSHIRPLRFSCLNLEHPIIPIRRGELDLKSGEEMLHNMRIRSSPVAQPYENRTLNLNGKTKDKVEIVAQLNGDAENNASRIEIIDYVDDGETPSLTSKIQQTADNTVEFHGLRSHLPLQWTHNMILGAYDDTCLDLQCYRKVGEKDLSDDSLLLMVKGDMNSNRTRVWDMGWRSTGSADEFEEVAREIEELVLSGLIEEFLMKPSSV